MLRNILNESIDFLCHASQNKKSKNELIKKELDDFGHNFPNL